MNDPGLNRAFRFLIPSAIERGVRYPDFVRDAKRAFIEHVIDRNHGNLSRAARDLGMHRNTLTRTMQELDIARRTLRPPTSAERNTGGLGRVKVHLGYEIGTGAAVEIPRAPAARPPGADDQECDRTGTVQVIKKLKS